MKIIENQNPNYKLAVFDNTPEINIAREQVHLYRALNKFFKKGYINDDGSKPEEFNKENSEPLKFESEELDGTQYLEKKADSKTGEKYFKTDRKDTFKLTDNGYYGGIAGYYHHVLYIDNHSLIPSMFELLKMNDDKHHRLYWEKKDIEKIKNYKEIPRRVKRIKKVKREINTYGSTSTWTEAERKQHKASPEHMLTSSINRRQAMYSGANLVYEEMNYFGFDKIVDVVNDGFIVNLEPYYYAADIADLDDKTRKQYYDIIAKEDVQNLIDDFLEHFKKEIDFMTFTIKQWDHCFVKASQEYLLMNDPEEGQPVTDYKLRNWTMDRGSYYESKTGHNLKADDAAGIVNETVLKNGTDLEMKNINFIYQTKIKHSTTSQDLIEDEESKQKIQQLLTDLGIDKINTKTKNTFHLYKIEVDEDNDKQDLSAEEQAYHDFFKLILKNNLFYIADKLPEQQRNLLGVLFKIQQLDNPLLDITANLKEYEKQANHKQIIRQWNPFFIYPKDEKTSPLQYVKSKLGEIKHSEDEHLVQERILETIAQLLAIKDGENPNNYLELFKKLKDEKAYKNWTLADKVRADHRVIVADGNMYVLDPATQTYTQNEKVRTALIQEYMSPSERNNIDAAIKNVYRNFQSTQYSTDELDEGFRTPNGAITFNKDSKGHYHYVNGSYYEGNYTQSTAISPDDSISSYKDVLKNTRGQLLWTLLNNVSGNKPQQLCQALGLIFARRLTPGVRRIFELYGVPGSGKSLLANMVAEIFDGISEDPAEKSKILTGSADINQVFNPKFVENYSLPAGQAALWLDDFIGKNKSKNIVLDGKAAGIINKLTSLQPVSVDTKYKKTDRVLMPNALFISSNKLIDPTINPGTTERLFVFESKQALANNPDFSFSDDYDFKSDKIVLSMLLKLMVLGAQDIYDYAFVNGSEQLRYFFKESDNAYKKNQNKMINDHFQAFIEEHDINSPYTFVGMQVSKLFKKYHEDSLGDHNASLASFKEQLSTIGLKIGDKKIRGKNYRKVILSSNNQLNKRKLDYLWEQYEVTPADVDKLRMNQDKTKADTFGTYAQWGSLEKQIKQEFPNDEEIFKAF